jgi:hypothetical protein
MLDVVSFNDFDRLFFHGVDLLLNLVSFLSDLLIYKCDLLHIDVMLKLEELLHVISL